MTFSGGILWWTVFGALLGWVGAWWLGRSTQRLLTEPVVRIVERQLDNPQHVMRIQHLDRELMAAREALAAERARADELAAAPAKIVEKVVTRTVEKPVDRIVERIVDRLVEKPVERIVEKPVDRVVERLVDRPVPDLAALAERDAELRARQLRIEHLEAMAAVLGDRVKTGTAAAAASPVAGTGATTAATTAAPAETLPGTDTRSLRQRIEHLEALAAVQAERLARARAPQRDLRSGDADIELVEGIGPKIAELLRARGLGSFGALADASPGTLREILASSGPAYRIADPSTWPEQARLAADGRWDELRSLQDTLNAGRRADDRGDHA